MTEYVGLLREELLSLVGAKVVDFIGLIWVSEVFRGNGGTVPCSTLLFVKGGYVLGLIFDCASIGSSSYSEI